MSGRLNGDKVTLVPVLAEHVAELRRIVRTPEVSSRWGREEVSRQWPLDDLSVVPFAVLEDGIVVGMVQYGEEEDPMYRHASVDIFLDPAVHGRGIGRDAIRIVAYHLFHDLGHHRLVIDPAVDNEPAIRAYTAAGFMPVGVMRRYERDADGDGWHDGLLMDMVVGEFDLRPDSGLRVPAVG